MDRTCLLPMLTLGLLMALSDVVKASPPWNGLLSLGRAQADPESDYPVTEQNGPWMIMVASFSGEGARDQARALVQELRQRYKLEAYTHKMHFDLDEVLGRGVDRYGNRVRMKYRKGSDIDEWAVLVGNYQSVDDPDAQKTLQKIKYSQPKCLELQDGKPTNQSLAGWRVLQKQLQSAVGSEKKKKGPMGHAFVARNPLLPKEYFAPDGLDELVLDMNRDVPHSLLDCPGKYSVLVATFKGSEVVEPKDIRAVQDGKPLRSTLEHAAYKAHVLTEALRLKNYEAYEFHDRYASIVTVGSFDSMGTPRADGRIEINPKVHATINHFKADETSGGKPKKIGPLPVVGEIFFDLQPIPVEVPKRSISAAYHRSSRASR